MAKAIMPSKAVSVNPVVMTAGKKQYFIRAEKPDKMWYSLSIRKLHACPVLGSNFSVWRDG